jgi:hypothetical protein
VAALTAHTQAVDNLGQPWMREVVPAVSRPGHGRLVARSAQLVGHRVAVRIVPVAPDTDSQGRHSPNHAHLHGRKGAAGLPKADDCIWCTKGGNCGEKGTLREAHVEAPRRVELLAHFLAIEKAVDR